MTTGTVPVKRKDLLSMSDCRERLADGVETFDTVALSGINFNVTDTDFFGSFKKKDTSLSKQAISDLLDIARVPVTFLRKDCDNAELNKSILDYCVKRHDAQVSIATRGDQMTRIFPAVANPIGALEVFDEVSHLSNEWIGAKCSVNGSTRITLVSPHETQAKKAGDIINSGLFVNIGSSIDIAAYLNRLICSNGMSRTVYDREFEAMATRDMLPVIRFQGRRCLEFAQETYAHEFVGTENERVTNPAVMMQRMGERRGLPLKTIAALIDAVPTLPTPCSYYDVINMITAAARDLEDAGAYNHSDRLVGLADSITAESHAQTCSTCHNPI